MKIQSVCAFQLTRPLRGATLGHSYARDEALISTHTPLAGRDSERSNGKSYAVNFNSHAPCGARHPVIKSIDEFRNFNSHAPCGARLVHEIQFLNTQPISTHTPLAGRDVTNNHCSPFLPQFQLTRPLRGATTKICVIFVKRIHFNSHAPCGARLFNLDIVQHDSGFQLTRPLRGATRPLAF